MQNDSFYSYVAILHNIFKLIYAICWEERILVTGISYPLGHHSPPPSSVCQSYEMYKQGIVCLLIMIRKLSVEAKRTNNAVVVNRVSYAHSMLKLVLFKN